MHLSGSGALPSCLLELHPSVSVSCKFVESQSRSINTMPTASVAISPYAAAAAAKTHE